MRGAVNGGVLGAAPGNGGGFGAMTDVGAETRGGSGGAAIGALPIGGVDVVEAGNGARETAGVGAAGGVTGAGDFTGGIEGACGAE